MEIKEKIGKALEELNDPSKHSWIGSIQYIRLDYVERLLLELLNEQSKTCGEEEK